MGHAVQGNDFEQLILLDVLVHDVAVGLYGSPAPDKFGPQGLFTPAPFFIEENESVSEHAVHDAPYIAFPRVVLPVVYRYRALVDVLVYGGEHQLHLQLIEGEETVGQGVLSAVDARRGEVHAACRWRPTPGARTCAVSLSQASRACSSR